MHAGTVTPVMTQRFLNLNRRLSLLNPSIKVMDKSVQLREQWRVVYECEKSEHKNKSREIRLSQERFSTFDEVNSCQVKLQVAEKLFAKFSNGKISIGINTS